MLKFINKISFKFSSKCGTAKSLRSFLYLVNKDKFIKENPKLNIQVTNSETFRENPILEIEYSDKKKLEINTRNLPAKEIYDDVERHVRKLRLDWDIKQSQ
jgi:hypothetical protein